MDKEKIMKNKKGKKEEEKKLEETKFATKLPVWILILIMHGVKNKKIPKVIRDQMFIYTHTDAYERVHMSNFILKKF